MLVFVYAQDKSGGIGKDNSLPWKLPSDMKHFKNTTMGHTIVMGRRTFESMDRRLLPGRRTVVVTRDPDYGRDITGLIVINELNLVVEMAQDDTIMVIGGSDLFMNLKDNCELIKRTVIDFDFACDTFMPEIPKSRWELIESKEGTVDDKNIYHHRFETWKRRI